MANTITLGGGCFWCLEAAFQQIKGINHVISGYANGDTDKPTYNDICSGNTGYAEVVQIEYDVEILDIDTVLLIFFTMHDPTTLNRQGNDLGTQYRSVILYHDDSQREAAENMIVDLNSSNTWPDDIVTVVEPLKVFYRAEDNHQNYFNENPSAPYCQVVVKHKVEHLRQVLGSTELKSILV